jgi:peptide/nickel transport system permease protein
MARVMTGMAILILLILGALLYPWLSPFDPLKPDYQARYAAPSSGHPLGTDGLGRDVLARSLAGGRVSLSIALSASALAVVLGSGLGLTAAAFGGTLELLLTRAFDALLAFPGFLLVLLVVVILGGGSAETILALGVAGSPLYFRLARSYTRSLLITPFVLAATALGASLSRLLTRHVLPNFLGPLLVQAASTTTVFLLVEASLSYLGLGVPLPTPSWGNVLQEARAYLTRQPWAALGPGALLALAALALQLLSDGLRDLLDRRTR